MRASQALNKVQKRLKIHANLTQNRGSDHYQEQLKKKCFLSWREFIRHRNHGSLQLSMAIQHQNKKLLLICWKYWTKFVVKKREKWKLTIKADLHFSQRILKKIVGTWKVYCNNMKEIKSFAEEKKACCDKKTKRFLFHCWRENAQYLKTSKQNNHTSSQYWKYKTMEKVFQAWRVYAEGRSWKRQQEMSCVVEAKKRLERGKLYRTLHLWRKEYLMRISSKKKWTKATEHWERCTLKNAFDILKKYRFLGYRKQILRQQCMLYHNERIIASHWKTWRTRYAERVAFLKKSRMALWMWSFTLQRKAFVSWFYYAAEKRRKKVAIRKALERRQQWLHKVSVMQWIKFATYFIAEREWCAASRHVQLSQNVQRNVQRYALHWRRKTERNRGKRREISRQPFDVRAGHVISHKAISGEDRRNTSKTPVISIVQNLPSIKRPQPRIPEYLRESFNLSELSEHTPASEAVPRHLPPNFRAVVQPDNLPEPTKFTSSVSSNTSQTGFREIVPSKSSSRNPQTVSKKVHSGTKPVLLPPSSFVRTTKPVIDGSQSSQECKKRDEKNKKVDEPLSVGEEVLNNEKPPSNTIAKFLSDKDGQQSVVQLRNRMLKYYTISTQLRDLKRKLSGLRQWSCDPRENDATLNEEEMSLVEEIIDELTENVESTRDNLEQSYKTIANDLQQLLDNIP